MEQELLLLKNALMVFVKEACTVTNGIPLFTQGYLRARYVEDEVIGPRWETYTETRLSLPRLQHEFFHNIKGLFSTGLVLEALRHAPQIAAKLVFPLEESEWVISERSLRGAIWDAVLGPYLEQCWLQHGSIRFDEQIFDQVFQHSLSDIQEPGVETETNLCPIPYLKLVDGQIDLSPRLRIRPLKAEELEVWLNPSWHWYEQRLSVGDYLRAQCAIEAVHTRPSDHYTMENLLSNMQLDKEESGEISKVLGTLRLLTDASINVAFTQKTQRGLLRRRQQITYPQTPRPSKFSKWITIDATSKETLLRLWNRLHAGDVAEDVELPFRRWYGAADRLEDADRLIDYWVGLEALFSPDSTQEVKFRASLRIAAYLGDTPDQWEHIYSEMRHSYDWRSTVVHGGSHKEHKKLDKRGNLQTMTAKTRAYLRQALLKLLNSDEALSIKPGESEIKLLRRLGKE